MSKGKMVSTVWEKHMGNFGAFSTELLLKFRGATFAPSRELLKELTLLYQTTSIEAFENGKTFSSYIVYFEHRGQTGQVYYKTTYDCYPFFHPYETMEEYRRSFQIRS